MPVAREVVRERVVGSDREPARDAERGDSRAGEPSLPSMIRQMVVQPIRREEIRERVLEPILSAPVRVVPSESEPPSRVEPLRQEGTAEPKPLPARRGLGLESPQPLRPRPDVVIPPHAPGPPAPATVNIRIGRIEVRAIQGEEPPAAAERPVPRAYVMGLDEYLTQGARRNG